MDVVDSELRKRLQHELIVTVNRLRELGGPESLAAIRDSLGANTALDEVDPVQASQGEDLAMATRERLTERLHRIQTALERLDQAAYGRCVDCGEPIEAGRLQAMPEAETCVACQERREQTGHAEPGEGRAA